MQLSDNKNPATVAFESVTFGPPLPATVTLFTFDRVSRIIYSSAQVTKTIGGFLIQSVSMHDETGAIIFAASLMPALTGISAFGPFFVLAQAGPEQARVPFFISNIIDGTWPKDCYAQPGWTMRANNLIGLAGASAIYKIQYAVNND